MRYLPDYNEKIRNDIERGVSLSEIVYKLVQQGFQPEEAETHVHNIFC